MKSSKTFLADLFSKKATETTITLYRTYKDIMTEMKQEGPPVLTSKQKKYLKGLAHDLTALIQVGKEGLSESLIEAIDQELVRRELIKVKLGKNCGLEKDAAGPALSEATNSSLVQLIGKTLILYRANPKRKKDERIRLPKE